MKTNTAMGGNLNPKIAKGYVSVSYPNTRCGRWLCICLVPKHQMWPMAMYLSRTQTPVVADGYVSVSYPNTSCGRWLCICLIPNTSCSRWLCICPVPKHQWRPMVFLCLSHTQIPVVADGLPLSVSSLPKTY